MIKWQLCTHLLVLCKQKQMSPEQHITVGKIPFPISMKPGKVQV